MSYWAPLEILGFARKAGFDNVDAKYATAISLVATGGADHYQHDTPGVAGSGLYGLWGLPLSDTGAVSVSDLMSVACSGQRLRECFVSNGRRWNWHPAYKSDAGAAVRRTWDALELDGLWTAKRSHMFGAMQHLRDADYRSDRINKILSLYPPN
jgi:hypothetical protein